MPIKKKEIKTASAAFLFQVLSMILPAMIMVLTIPVIRNQLDVANFAGFTLLLTIVSFILAFDGGLGRASTYFITLSLKKEDRDEVLPMFYGILLTGLFFSVFLILLSLICLNFAKADSFELVKKPILLLIVFIPLFVSGSLLRGFLEAKQAFILSSLLQSINGCLIAIAPVILFWHSDNLCLFSLTIGLVRLLYITFLFHFCGIINFFEIRRDIHISTIVGNSKRVLNYAQWLFLSNLVGLTIVYADRMTIASFFSATTISAYVLPMEVVSKLQIFVAAFCTIMFPRIVSNKLLSKTFRIKLLINSQGLIISSALLLSISVMKFSKPIIIWWLGKENIDQASTVFGLGVFGIGLIGCAALAMLDLNSQGISKSIAILHILELPLYLVGLYYFAQFRSVDFILMMWLVRLAVDALAMNIIVIKYTGVHEIIKGINKDSIMKFIIPWLVLLLTLISILVIVTNNSISFLDNNDLTFFVLFVLLSVINVVFWNRLKQKAELLIN